MSSYTGGTSAADIARLRRMVAEPSTTVYSDVLLVDAIERHPVPDPDDVYPDEAGWFPTYDLALAAAEIWAEKAATVAAKFDFDADGASYSRSQIYEHFNAQARKWRSLRVPGNYEVVTLPPSSTSTIIGNVNNPYA